MTIKKFIAIFFTFLLFLIVTVSVTAQSSPPIYFFYTKGCPHCAVVEKYIEEEGLEEIFQIEKKEIYFNRENTELFNSTLDRLKIPIQNRGVPTVVYNNQVIIGDKDIVSFFQESANSSTTSASTFSVQNEQNSGQKPDLTLFTVIAGSLVDAINPCEFAVLIILMSTILATGNSKRALWSGLAFSASIFISYFLMGLGFYKVIGVGGIAGWFYKFIGWVAVFLGLLNLKDWLWYGKGFLMEVPLSWRPVLKKLIKSATGPKGAFFIGFIVSLFLLPCTSGPYIIILGMLAKKALFAQAFEYLLIYNFIFISPMIIITLAVYKGFNPAKAENIRQKHLKMLHLIAGVILLVMGGVILTGWL